jgi:hypothetical protein
VLASFVTCVVCRQLEPLVRAREFPVTTDLSFSRQGLTDDREKVKLTKWKTLATRTNYKKNWYTRARHQLSSCLFRLLFLKVLW